MRSIVLILLLFCRASPALAEEVPRTETPPLPGPVAGTVVSAESGVVLLSFASGPSEGASLRPGTTVGVYASDVRPDPRNGALVQGFRYAGDARITWSSGGLLELVMAHPNPVDQQQPMVLGEPMNLEPTRAWQPPAMVHETAPVELVEKDADMPISMDPEPKPRRSPLATNAEGVRLTSVHEHNDAALGELRQSMTLRGGFAGDGYDTGLGWWNVAWRIRPRRGPALVDVGLEGLRGMRWVEGDVHVEPWAREPAVSYALWTRVESAGVGLALIGGMGFGVDDQGTALSALLGVRTGQPLGSHVALTWEARGRMGQRVVLDGRVALTDAFRMGVRTRAGTVPLHQGDFEQERLDGAVVVDLDATRRFHVLLAAGMGGYDLLFADAGPVLDGELEIRW